MKWFSPYNVSQGKIGAPTLPCSTTFNPLIPGYHRGKLGIDQDHVVEDPATGFPVADVTGCAPNHYTSFFSQRQ